MCKVVHLHGVVNHQIDGHKWVDALRVTAQAAHGVAHGCQIHHARHAGKVLHDHARRHKGQLVGSGLAGVPRRQAFYISWLHEVAVAVAQQSFQQHADGKWQMLHAAQAALFQRVEAEDGVFAQLAARPKRIGRS